VYLLNTAATLQCAHGGVFPLIPSGPRPLVGGAPGLVMTDLLGKVALGCVFNISGVPAPCTIVGVVSGVCTKVTYGGQPALHQGVVCATTNGTPNLPCANAGQAVVQGM
jgi:hypothetical protein